MKKMILILGFIVFAGGFYVQDTRAQLEKDGRDRTVERADKTREPATVERNRETPERDTEIMRAHNERVRAREAARPAQETDYRQSEKYKAASPERRAQIDATVERAVKSLIKAGAAEAVALTLGGDGALLVTREAVWRAQPMAIEAVSTVGAGDSFLAAMVFALAEGRDPADAFRFGIAAGSAAVLNPGTNLAHPEDIARLFPQVDPGRRG